MNKQAIYHYNDSSYCFALDRTHLKLRLRTAKNDPDIETIECIWSLSHKYYDEHYCALMTKMHQDEFFDYYECTLESEDPRFVYIFKIYLKNGKTYYLSERGLADYYDYADSEICLFKFAYMNDLDIHYRNPKFDGEICYQIFPERFKSADKSLNKDYVNRPWDTTDLKGAYGNLVHNVFIGGDLEGIYQELEYLKSLNVGIVYMTPISKSSSNHKYDVEDYMMIDPMFGDDAKLEKLVNKAHKLGMKVVLDLVFNHSSNKNPMFLDCKEKGKKSKFWDFYMIHGDKVEENPKNYETFANVSRMPKLNTNNYKVQDYILKVAKHYVRKFKIDAYRLDVANEVSHAFWQRFKNELRRIEKDIFIIGECFNNSYKYLDSHEFDSIMNYQFLQATREFYAQHRLTAEEYKNRLESLLMRYDENTNYNLLNLIDSHDTERFYNLVKPNKNVYLLAVLTLIFHVGIPMVYYGDEIFMEGGRDPFNRKGMEWNSKEFKSKYFELFKAILHLRDIETIKHGSMSLTNEYDFFIMRRYDDKSCYKVIINNSNEDKEYFIHDEIILSNNFENNTLKAFGFVIIKEN